MEWLCDDGTIRGTTFFSMSMFVLFCVLLVMKLGGVGAYRVDWWMVVAPLPAMVLLRSMLHGAVWFSQWLSRKRKSTVRRFL